MLKKLFVLLVFILILALSVSAVQADETDMDVDTDTEMEDFYPWKHHEAPFDFKFGAMIDSHQQSQVNPAGILQGFIYIQRTGVVTEDGIPIAEKAHCSTETCSLGWVIKGVPVQATLVHVAPRVWLVSAEDLPNEPGYTHFQWVGPPKTPHELVLGNTYGGYLLKRVAPEPFYWLGGGPGDSGGGPGGGSGGCGNDTGDTGGCTGHDSGDTGDTGGCTGHDSGDTGDTGGCTGHDSGDIGDTGGCTGHDSGDTGGCSGHDGGDTGGSSGHSGGSDGRLVGEGVDPHSNIVTVWDGTWTGGCGGHDGDDTGGCGDDSGSCGGH